MMYGLGAIWFRVKPPTHHPKHPPQLVPIIHATVIVYPKGLDMETIDPFLLLILFRGRKPPYFEKLKPSVFYLLILTLFHLGALPS